MIGQDNRGTRVSLPVSPINPFLHFLVPRSSFLPRQHNTTTTTTTSTTWLVLPTGTGTGTPINSSSLHPPPQKKTKNLPLRHPPPISHFPVLLSASVLSFPPSLSRTASFLPLSLFPSFPLLSSSFFSSSLLLFLVLSLSLSLSLSLCPLFPIVHSSLIVS